MSGRFITFEGGEGAGKSTQISLLADWLRAQNIAVAVTREPGGTPGAEQIRALLVAGEPGRWQGVSELLLHYAARCDHVARFIKPRIAAGTWILCDRFADSTRAYQGYGHRLELDLIEQVNHLTMGDFAPDATLIMDIPMADGLARAAGRAGAQQDASDENRYERMDKDFHERVRQGFLSIAAQNEGRCAIVDASQSVAQVHEAVKQAVMARFSKDIQFADIKPQGGP